MHFYSIESETGDSSKDRNGFTAKRSQKERRKYPRGLEMVRTNLLIL